MGTFTCSNQCNDTDLLQSYIPASSSLSPEGPSTGPEGQQRCQRWPLHRKNGRKRVLLCTCRPLTSSCKSFTLSWRPPTCRCASCKVTFRLPHLLLNPPLPLCHAPTHLLGLWEISVCISFKLTTYFLLLLFPYFWFHHLINTVGNMASLESWFNFICSKH